MLTRDQKKQLVEELSENIKNSKTTVVCDYKGVPVSEMRKIRRKLRESDARMQIVRKTLASIAYKNADIDFDVTQLEGQDAIIYGGGDEITAPKVLFEASKENENFKIIAGTLEGKVMSGEEMNALAKLPGREELLAKLVGTINAPVSNFVGVLSGNLRNLVGVLSAIKESKE